MPNETKSQPRPSRPRTSHPQPHRRPTMYAVRGGMDDISARCGASVSGTSEERGDASRRDATTAMARFLPHATDRVGDPHLPGGRSKRFIPGRVLFRIRPGSIGIHTRSSRNGTTLAPVNVHDVHLMARPPTGTAGASGGGGTCSETPETDWFWGTGPPASVDPVPLLPDQEAPKQGLGGPSNLWGGSGFPSSQRPARGAVPSPQVSLHGQLFPGMMNGSRHTTPQYEARRENGRSLAGPGLEQQLPRGPGLAPYHEAPFLAVELP